MSEFTKETKKGLTRYACGNTYIEVWNDPDMPNRYGELKPYGCIDYDTPEELDDPGTAYAIIRHYGIKTADDQTDPQPALSFQAPTPATDTRTDGPRRVLRIEFVNDASGQRATILLVRNFAGGRQDTIGHHYKFTGRRARLLIEAQDNTPGPWTEEETQTRYILKREQPAPAQPAKEYPEAMRELIEFYGEPISTYTRAQAIEDGFLIDLNQWIPIEESGYKIPAACTAAVWGPIETTVKGTHRDYKGVIWDIFWMSRAMAKQTSDDTRIFKVKIGRAYQYLKAVVSGGDDGEPVLTFMLQSED